MKFKEGEKVRLKSSITSLDLKKIHIYHPESVESFLKKRHIFIVHQYRKLLIYPSISNLEVHTKCGWTFPEIYLESAQESRSHPLTNIFKNEV